MSLGSCSSPGGRLMCLHGSVCNQTLGICEQCPAGFTADETVLRGNQNCGLPVAFAAVVYILTSLFAVYVAVIAARLAQHKVKGSRVRLILLWIAIWNALIPPYLLTHYLSGFKQGPAAVFLFTLISIMVNMQISLLGYMLWRFMTIICRAWSERYIYLVCKYWAIVSISMKLATGIAQFVCLLQGNLVGFNLAQMVCVLTLYVETTVNVYIGYSNSIRMIHALETLQSDNKVTSLSDDVVEFVERVRRTKNIQPIFAAFFIVFATALVVLFAIYGGSVPYQFVLWSFPLLVWPLLGLGPALRADSGYVTHMERKDQEPPDTMTSDRLAMKRHLGAGENGSLVNVDGRFMLTTLDSTPRE